MKLIDSLRRAWRSLGSAKARTLLTSLAIAVGAFTLTLALAGGTGARHYADKLITSNVDPQSIIVVKDKKMTEMSNGDTYGLQEYSADATQFRGATFDTLTKADLDTLSHVDGVESVVPSYIVKAEYVTFEGKDKKYTTDITTYDPTVRAEIAAGSLPPLGKQIGNDTVVLPEGFASTIGYRPQELVGKRVTLHLIKSTKTPTEDELRAAFVSGGVAAVETLTLPEVKNVTLTVAAVSAKSSTSFSASSALFISQQRAEELSNYLTEGTKQYQTYISAYAIAKQGVDAETVAKQIEKNGVYAMTAKDLQKLIFTIVNLLQGIVIGFGALALIASVFGIINTQYISVLERTREIGLMKALGMRGRHVRRLFQYEAAWIGFLGGVIGSLIAWGGGVLVNPWLSDKLSIGDNRILVFEFWPIAGLVAGLMLVAMLAGWFPARKAAKLDPIEALRTE